MKKAIRGLALVLLWAVLCACGIPAPVLAEASVSAGASASTGAKEVPVPEKRASSEEASEVSAAPDIREASAPDDAAETATDVVEEKPPDEKEVPAPEKGETSEEASEVTAAPGIREASAPDDAAETALKKAVDYFYDYAVVSDWDSLARAAWSGAKKFLLTGDIVFPQTWEISMDGIVINGNGHTIKNGGFCGSCIHVKTGGVVTLENGLTIDGSCVRTTGAVNAGDSTVSVDGGTLYARDCTVCNSWNYGYLDTGAGLGGGTGFNAIGTGRMYLENCAVYNCDGAAYFVRDDAYASCKNCIAWDSSWGFCIGDGEREYQQASMDLSGCRANASRAHPSMEGYGGAGLLVNTNCRITVKDCMLAGYWNGASVTQGQTAFERCLLTTYGYEEYCRNHPDILAAWPQNAVMASWHFAACGMAEGRSAKRTEGNSVGIYGATVDLNDCEVRNSHLGIGGVWATCVVRGGSIHGNDTGAGLQIAEFYLQDGSIFGNNCGIEVTFSSLHMSGGAVYDNDCDGILVQQDGKLFLCGGEILKNRQSGIHNRAGALSVTGGSCYANGMYGINNESAGAVSFSSGCVRENGYYDIRQGGADFCMNGDAATGQKGVLLEKGCSIRVKEPLTAADGGIALTLAEDNLTPGTLCVKNETVLPTLQLQKKFSLQNQATATKTERKMPNGLYQRVAVLRPGNGRNGGRSSDLVLSEEYYVLFASSIDGEHLTVSLPMQQTIFWREDNWISPGTAQTYYHGSICRALRHIGWSKKPDASSVDCNAEGVICFDWKTSVSDKTLYPVFVGVADLAFCGNGQTSGEDYTIQEVSGNAAPLPKNTFARTESNTYKAWDGLLGREVETEETLPYSFQGWSLSSEAVYKDAGVEKEGAFFDVTKEVIARLTAGNARLDERGCLTLPLYAVWDAAPVLTAPDQYFSYRVLEQGELTPELLLERATVWDREDKDEPAPELVDFDLDLYRQLSGDFAYATVTYRCCDGAGNEGFRRVRLYFTADGIFRGDRVDDNPLYARFIDKQYFESHDKRQGGLVEESVWYEDETYETALRQTFERLEQGEYKSRYVFEKENIIKSQGYVRKFGPGNIASQDCLTKYRKEVQMDP